MATKSPERALSLRDGFSAILTTGATTPDSVALSVVGDLDLRILARVHTRGWSMCSKRLAAGNQSSWWVIWDAADKLQFLWSPTGAAGAEVSSLSTVAAGIPVGKWKWLRAVLDVDNGAGGNDTLLYTGDDNTLAAFTQLGTTITHAGVTSIFDSTTDVRLGGFDNHADCDGEIAAFEMRSGINGAVIASFDAREHVAIQREATYTDPQGNVWTMAGSAAPVYRHSSRASARARGRR